MTLAPTFSHPDAQPLTRARAAACAEESMRLTVNAFGLELDLTLGRETKDADDDTWVDCGATLSAPVGFYRPEIPWDHDGPVHHFDPSEGDEDI